MEPTERPLTPRGIAEQIKKALGGRVFMALANAHDFSDGIRDSRPFLRFKIQTEKVDVVYVFYCPDGTYEIQTHWKYERVSREIALKLDEILPAFEQLTGVKTNPWAGKTK